MCYDDSRTAFFQYNIILRYINSAILLFNEKCQYLLKNNEINGMVLIGPTFNSHIDFQFFGDLFKAASDIPKAIFATCKDVSIENKIFTKNSKFKNKKYFVVFS